jgi:hypothetical protein
MEYPGQTHLSFITLGVGRYPCALNTAADAHLG